MAESRRPLEGVKCVCVIMFQQVPVAHVARHPLELQAGKGAQITVRPHQCLYMLPARKKLADKVRANETRSACNKAIHCPKEGLDDSATTRRGIPQLFFTSGHLT